MKPKKRKGQITIRPKAFEKKYKEVNVKPQKVKVYEKAKSVLTAIRNKCLWCCGDSRLEVNICPHGGDCPDFGHIKSRSEKCRICKTQDEDQYIRCRSVALGLLFTCPLWPFRFGKNPFHKVNLSEEQRKIRSERMKQYKQSLKENQNGQENE
jgi:hypothetical protein